jgi:hypothetical protein
VFIHYYHPQLTYLPYYNNFSFINNLVVEVCRPYNMQLMVTSSQPNIQ